MALIVEVATDADIPAIIASAEALVATDAGRYDADATDLGWAARTGPAYCQALLSSDDNLVLLARESGDDGENGVVVGHLVARLGGPSSVHPVRVAELESIHVYPDHRGRGVGERLVAEFLVWAGRKGADRASVTAYAANAGALRFYQRHGFAPRSVVLDRDVA
ncbi:MAG TPA: GNAT family N-acetyltransferase [Micromonosporaceae bacterium]|jgi:ribosomal protein S18 acetylase RimI-like enzyme